MNCNILIVKNHLYHNNVKMFHVTIFTHNHCQNTFFCVCGLSNVSNLYPCEFQHSHNCGTSSRWCSHASASGPGEAWISAPGWRICLQFFPEPKCEISALLLQGHFKGGSDSNLDYNKIIIITIFRTLVPCQLCGFDSAGKQLLSFGWICHLQSCDLEEDHS